MLFVLSVIIAYIAPATEINKLSEIEKPIDKWSSPKPTLVTKIAYPVVVDSTRDESIIPLQITSSKTALISEKNKQNNSSDWIYSTSF